MKRDAAVTAHEVTLEITSVSPSTGLNPAGGDIVTITGTNFPESNDSRYNLSILISGQARCVPQSITTTEIICETEPIVTSRRRMLVDTVDISVSLTSDEETTSAD